MKTKFMALFTIMILAAMCLVGCADDAPSSSTTSTTSQVVTEATTSETTTEEVDETTEATTAKSTTTTARQTTAVTSAESSRAATTTTSARTTSPASSGQSSQQSRRTEAASEPARTEAQTEATTARTTSATTPRTTTVTTTATTSTSPTTSTTTTTTTTSTTPTTTTSTTSATTTTVTETTPVEPVYTGPLFEDSNDRNPDFDPNSYAWDTGDEWCPPDLASYEINGCFYVDNYMQQFGYYHDDCHYWSKQSIGYTNAAGDEIIFYPDKVTMTIGGHDYYADISDEIRGWFENGTWSRRTITNGNYYFVFDYKMLHSVLTTLPGLDPRWAH